MAIDRRNIKATLGNACVAPYPGAQASGGLVVLPVAQPHATPAGQVLQASPDGRPVVGPQVPGRLRGTCQEVKAKATQISAFK